MHSHTGRHERCVGIGRGAFALPGTERKYERSLPFRFQHLFLDLRILVNEAKVRGSSTLTIERVDAHATELKLDAVDFDVKDVELDSGKGFVKASFDYDDKTLTIEMAARFKRGRVRVTYEAAPKRGLYFLKPDEHVKDRPRQVWSQCQDEDARHWFPCHDKPHVKMPADFRYTVPAGMQLLANGERVERPGATRKKNTKKKSTSGTTTFHYRVEQPLPSYLVTLVVGEFEVIEDRPAKFASGREVPIEYWVPKGKRQEGLRAFHRTPEMIELFSRKLGVEYPFSRYTQVVVSDFIFGGMENTTATTMYEHVLLDERAAIDVESHDLVAHELAHQWFGDWVTCRDWPEAWLNEGFATFFEHVEREDRKGRDEYIRGLERDLGSYLSEAGGRYRRPIISRDYEEPIDLFDRHLYEKGSLVLHLLRVELGEELFWKGLNEYLRAHGGATVETTDLKAALERVSGRSLDRFFEEWVRRSGHPQLKIKISWAGKLLTLQCEQTHRGESYDLLIEFEVRTKKNRIEAHSFRLDQRHGSVTLPFSERPVYVAIDPNFRLVGELTVEVPPEMSRQQLLLGRSARERRSAAQRLSKKHDFKTLEALRKVLLDEKVPWMVRAECAKSCGKLGNDDALSTLCLATDVKSPEVRAAVAEALGQFTRDESAKALVRLLKKEKSYVVTAAATLSLAKTKHASAQAELERQLGQPSWADIVASSALDGLAELRNQSNVDVLKRYAAYGQPTRVRRSAVTALAKLNRERETREFLAEQLRDPHPHFRLSVVSALEELDDSEVRSVLSRHLAHENDGRVARRIKEARAKLASNASQRELKDQVSQLEKELNELKARLSTLEAKTTVEAKSK